jgi:hypothetical protein
MLLVVLLVEAPRPTPAARRDGPPPAPRPPEVAVDGNGPDMVTLHLYGEIKSDDGAAAHCAVHTRR